MMSKMNNGDEDNNDDELDDDDDDSYEYDYIGNEYDGYVNGDDGDEYDDDCHDELSLDLRPDY